MNQLDELEAKLRREAQSWAPSPNLEANLLKEWGQGFRPAAGLLPGVFGVAAVLAIAAIVLLAFMLPKPKPAATPRPQVAKVIPSVPATRDVAARPRHRTRRKAPQPPESDFIRIPYSIPLAPYERAEIVRVELPVSALTSTGLRIATADTGATAQADLIVGEDGMARAVRVISILNNR
jgi:hypothetical protein